MYLSMKAAFVRNIAIALVNGLITLALLLIAPLGLAGVITNTVCVTVATFLVGTGFDLVIGWLSTGGPPDTLSGRQRRNMISFDSPLSSEIDKIRRDQDQ